MRQRLQSGGRFFIRLIVALASLILFGSPICTAKTSQAETPRVFRFHMPTELSSLDPAMVTTNDASYFLNNVMRGLYSYADKKGLYPEQAESCRFESKIKLVCSIAKDALWSDGSRVVAGDYVRAFRRLVRPSAKNLSIELLRNLKNAIQISSGHAPPESLGIHEEHARLVLDFEKPDPEFLYKLTASILVPVKTEIFPKRENSKDAITNGPYRVVSWAPGKRIRLESNTFYKRGSQNRPPVEILIVEDDETALGLYEQGELNFLRRLPTTLIRQYKDRADFFQIPVARFDYMGFGADLKDQADLRKSLSLSVDYKELKKAVDARGTPGCPGLNTSTMDKVPCLEFDLRQAKVAFARVPESVKQTHLKMTFSKLGGDDVKKMAEWFQAQWKKNLGLDIELEQNEQAVHLQTLRLRPPALYRKGLHPERPTCLAALEGFATGGSENFLKINEIDLDHDIDVLSRASLNKNEALSRRTCTHAVQLLLDESRIIPLGQVQFTLLARPEFRGWSLNEMNQLDLSSLSNNELKATGDSVDK